MMCGVTREDDADFLQLNGRARHVGGLLPARRHPAAPASSTRIGISWPTRISRLAIVQRHDARLRLKIGEPDFLECVEEARELEFSECRGEDELERRDSRRACSRWRSRQAHCRREQAGRR